MDASPQFPPLPEDVAFFEHAVLLTKDIYALHGSLEPIAMIKISDPKTGETQTMVLQSEPLNTTEDKQKFIAMIQLAGVTHNSPRSLVVLESYAMFDQDPRAMQLLQEITARGGSIQEHPNHFEAVAINLESDWGCISQTFKINRLHETMAELVPATEMEFYAKADPDSVIEGHMTGFHIPTSVRETPQGQKYAQMLSDNFALDLNPNPIAPEHLLKH